MTRSVSLADAKARLSECVRDAERGDSIVITRHGKPVAALVRAEEVHLLERLRAAGPEGGLAGLAGGWEGSGQLVDILKNHTRDRRSQGPARSRRSGGSRGTGN